MVDQLVTAYIQTVHARLSLMRARPIGCDMPLPPGDPRRAWNERVDQLWEIEGEVAEAILDGGGSVPVIGRSE